MKLLKRKILIIAIIIQIIYILSANVLADPAVVDISINPTSPTPKSTITFTATVSGDQITEVFLNINECKDDFCYADAFRESMDKVETGKYQKKITLIHPDSNKILYWLEIDDDGTLYDFKTDMITKDLSINETDSTPGFELLGLLLSIILLFIIKITRR